MPDLQRPRIVIVTRPTLLEHLLARHGTRGQARFFLESRDKEIEPLEEAHARQEEALARVTSTLPADRRRVRIDRSDVDRFLFAPDDVVLVVGQDGLVPNVAKYLDGQRTIGINPDPERYDGVLCRHSPADVRPLLDWLESPHDHYRVERRTMVRAERDDGQALHALNEVFVGHESHQSARYRLEAPSGSERHSSSGVICCSGTGSTGWARSIARQIGLEEPLPGPEDPRLAWFAREPFPSVRTGTELSNGFVGPGQTLVVHSEMAEGGVAFADGIEADRMTFAEGNVLRIARAEKALHLVVPADEPEEETEETAAAAAGG